MDGGGVKEMVESRDVTEESDKTEGEREIDDSDG